MLWEKNFFVCWFLFLFFRKSRVPVFYHLQASNLDLPSYLGEQGPCLSSGQRSRKINSHPRGSLIRKLQPSLSVEPCHYCIPHHLYCMLARAPRHLGSPHPNRWDFREPGKPRQSFDFYMNWQKTRHSRKLSNLPIWFVFAKFLLSQCWHLAHIQR